MTATVTNIDTERRHFAEFLATRVLHYAKRHCAWPFEGEDTKGPPYYWAKTDQNTKYRVFETATVLRHLTGVKTGRARHSGLGVPILADVGLAGIGVIDIDTHATGAVVDIAALTVGCYPAAVPTRSSSGRGIHVYLFPPCVINSHLLRLAMERYYVHLMSTGALANVEVDFFPKKHGSAAEDIGERCMSGGSVRFPFAAKYRPDFYTYDPTWPPPCDHAGEIYSSTGWVTDFSEKQRVILEAQAAHLTWLATWGGPPCLGRVLTEGGDQGDRNDLTYDAAFFAAFATQDEAIATRWVLDRIIPAFRGPPQDAHEVNRTIKSGVDHALDPNGPAYVCTTSICDKNEGRCMRLGQPTQSGYTAGATASGMVGAAQTSAAVAQVVGVGINALSEQDGKLCIGGIAVNVEYCPIEDRFYYKVGPYECRGGPTSVMNAYMVGNFASLLQRPIVLPRGTQKGWLIQVLTISRRVATPFVHPLYRQLKAALYQIDNALGASVSSVAVHEAMPSHRNLLVNAAMRHYPDTDWQVIISPTNEVLGMRLVLLDLDYLNIELPPPPMPTGPDDDDY